MTDDEISIIRRIRHEISEECGHDINKLVAYYKSVEDRLRREGKFRFARKTERAEPQQQEVSR